MVLYVFAASGFSVRTSTCSYCVGTRFVSQIGDLVAVYCMYIAMGHF